MRIGPILLAAVAAAALIVDSGPGQVPAPVQAPPPPATPVKPVPQPPDVAALRVGRDGQPSQMFLNMHESFLRRGKSGPMGVLFIGDSITQIFAGSWGKEVWAKDFTPLQAANFGIGGDCTQHVLWRIEHGELDGISPKVVVLLIGTNNLGGHDPAGSVLKGVCAIVAAIQAKLPRSSLIVMGIFPRWDRYRGAVETVNQGLARLDDGGQTRFLDIGPKLPREDYAPDSVHINAKGYQVWSDAVRPLVVKMMK